MNTINLNFNKKKIPISIYIHLPWCIKKCPYCDFNSYSINKNFNYDLENQYTNKLIADFDNSLKYIADRKITSIFFGGGTPSLFQPSNIEKILNHIWKHAYIDNTSEITLEANPGTFEAKKFADFKISGINRLSLGVQSFNNKHLKLLGRVHNSTDAKQAIISSIKSGFDNINIDLMHSLPQQSIQDSITDLKTALQYNIQHLSWYQLTIEKNTYFAKFPPVLPNEKILAKINTIGNKILSQNNFKQYEISAYSKKNQQCQHNKNYWQYGDYLGLGAGSHSKITDFNHNTVLRFSKYKTPKKYLACNNKFISGRQTLLPKERIFEFMLNALRLTNGIAKKNFNERTGIDINSINNLINQAKTNKFLKSHKTKIIPSKLGQKYLNDLLLLFL